MNQPMNNSRIIDTVLKGTNLYQLGVPDPTQVGIERTYRYMMSPNNKDVYNQFVQGLFRLIGTQLIRNREYINPLATFKRVNINRMQTIQEIGFHLVKARAYDQFDFDKFYEEHPPVIDAAYHSQNRQDKYKITINWQLLENAFLEEYGLNNFVSGALQQPINSDNHDEYNIMLDLIAKYEQRWGFRKVKVPEINGTTQGEAEFQAKQLIKAVRTVAGNWALDYDTTYNGYHLPVFTPLGKTYLITTPEIMAAIDVDVLAAAFNISNAELQQRTVLVSRIPVKDCYALLVDEDWFVCGDTLYENRTWENPETLGINYFLHHWGVLSTSPMLNCVAFVTSDGTPEKVTTVTPTGEFNIGLYDADGNPASTIVLGERNYVHGSLPWNVEPQNDNIPSIFTPTDFSIDKIEIPAREHQDAVSEKFVHAISNDAVTIAADMRNFVATVFGSGEKHDIVMEFVNHNGHWHLGSELVDLNTYGVTVSNGDPKPGDIITLTYTAQKDEVQASEAKPIALNSRTYIDNYGLIHFQAAVAPDMEVTITGTSTYNTDGVGEASKVTDTKVFKVTEY